MLCLLSTCNFCAYTDSPFGYRILDNMTHWPNPKSIKSKKIINTLDLAETHLNTHKSKMHVIVYHVLIHMGEWRYSFTHF